jgi:hypothetical protein
MRDTSREATERYYELLRQQAPAARLATAVRLSRVVREMAESAIRSADPSASPGVVRQRLAARLYGDEVARYLYVSANGHVG